MGNQGTAILDFGVKSVSTTVVISSEAGMLAGSQCEAWIGGNSTADNTEDDTNLENLKVTTKAKVAGAGFTIYGEITKGMGHGQHKINWVWN